MRTFLALILLSSFSTTPLAGQGHGSGTSTGSPTAQRLLRQARIAQSPRNLALAKTALTYRTALLTGKTALLLQLIHPRYLDDGGTKAPHDDTNAQAIRQRIKNLHRSVRVSYLTLKLLKIECRGPRCTMTVSCRATWTLLRGGRSIVRDDRNQMVLKQRRGRWLFISGL